MRCSDSSPTSNSVDEVLVQLLVDLGELVVVAREPQQVGAQVDEQLHAAVEPGEQAQQPARGRRERVAQRVVPRSGGRSAFRRDRRTSAAYVDRVGIDPEVAREHPEEAFAAGVRRA